MTPALPDRSLKPLTVRKGPDGQMALELREHCGLRHDAQVLVVEGLPEFTGAFALKAGDGRLFSAQRSQQNPALFFVHVALEPFEHLWLMPEKVAGELEGMVSVQIPTGNVAVIGNGKFALELPLGTDNAVRSGFDTSGPVRKFRIGDGAWRGTTFFDTRQSVVSSHGEILEEGAVRTVYRYRVEMTGGGSYTATVTVDAGQVFAKITEEFHGGRGDQIVWDFSGNDLPVEMYSLDDTASYRTRPLAYHYDKRLARLAAWTQQSQQLDYLDGYAFQFSNSPDVAGFITFEGGSWRGDKMNHLEAWVRRWMPGDKASRRDVPADSKADSYPGPERVAARGGVTCEAHFNVEGWTGNGRREYALVLTTLKEIQPQDLAGDPPLGHFEDAPDRERYARQQSLLRKIHIQRGVISLQELAGLDFEWPEEPLQNEESGCFQFPNDVIAMHFRKEHSLTDPALAAKEMREYIEARVFGFWEGSGIAYSNPVVGRRIAPEMFRYEWLLRNNTLDAGERMRLRALFAFLMHLFASENYYTGDATMLPADSPDSTEPTLSGMANQNFYTDVFNVFGAGAQIFHQHPRANEWRRRFIEQWHWQLAFHMYPESGLWEESHTYYQHVLHTVLPTFLRRRTDGVDDEFANPEMQKLVTGALKQVTPRDACNADQRYLITFGDHGPAQNPGLFNGLAEAFSKVNPTLAGNLAWLAGEMGGTSTRQGIASAAPELKTEWIEGLGVMFRGVDSTGSESLFALRSGLAWGHHHNDDGSIQFFAKGRALISDSAFGLPQGSRKFEAQGHSRWSPRDCNPVNYYWRFNRGWVTEAGLNAAFPFARSHSPVFTVRGGTAQTEILATPILHWRTVVQIDATTYLIIDVARTLVPQVVRFHLAGYDGYAEGSRAVLDFSNGRLTIAPVFADVAPALAVHSPSGTTDFSTTEVCYETGVAPVSVFVVRAGDAGERVEVSGTGDARSVRCGELDFEVTLGGDEVRVKGRGDGREMVVKMRDEFGGEDRG